MQSCQIVDTRLLLSSKEYLGVVHEVVVEHEVGCMKDYSLFCNPPGAFDKSVVHRLLRTTFHSVVECFVIRVALSGQDVEIRVVVAFHQQLPFFKEGDFFQQRC